MIPLMAAAVEGRTQELGRRLHAAARVYRPSLGERLQDWLMVQMGRDRHLQTRLLRFVDALAAMDFDRTGVHVTKLFREYFSASFPNASLLLRAGLALARQSLVPAPALASSSRSLTRAMARRFIMSSDAASRGSTLAYLERQGRFLSFDILGEQVVSRQEAEYYQNRYLELLEHLGRHRWAGQRTQAGVPKLQISIKLSSLTENFNPASPEGTLGRVRSHLEEVLERCARIGIGLTVDAEEFEYRELTWHLFTSLFGPGSPFERWDGAGIALQAYHADAEAHLGKVLDFAAERGTPFQVRLVRGAYWDYEVITAREKGWPVPVFLDKPDTDLAFEALLVKLLESRRVKVAVASHNLRCHAYAQSVSESLGLPAGHVEHQTLFRTAEGISRAITGMGWECRDYVPTGELVPGMAYLVRRVLENTSQVGFLMRSRVGDDVLELLSPPLPGQAGAVPGPTPPAKAFRNHPPKRLFLAKESSSFATTLAETRLEWGKEYPLEIGAERIAIGEVKPSLSPSHPDPAQPVGLVHMAGIREADMAIALAREGLAGWSHTPAGERVGILRRAAQLMAQRRDELAAWVVHEGGRTWAEALADVDEAIDHLACNAQRLLELQPILERDYRPRGVLAVIPPWNFPAALPMGMVAGALAAGNAVILKPAEETPVIAYKLVKVLHQAGVPPQCLIHLPGRGETVGAYLAGSPSVDMIAFTGSKAVGTLIYRAASLARPSRGIKKVVAEMGGKNPIVVFPDADMDEAVRGIVLSAFEHSNQKCSACSRVFVHRAIFPRLAERLSAAALSLPVGLAEDPDTLVNPLISAEARERVLAYADRARTEGKVHVDLARGDYPSPLHVGPLLVELDPQALPRSVIAREEVFGPVLALVPFEDEEWMLEQVNGTAYALTAGVFSRSPRRISRMVREIRAGNIYVNRKITGARVGVEPFGGAQLSGTGPKAGGPDYLFAFVTRRDGFDPSRRSPSEPVSEPLTSMAGLVNPWLGARAIVRGKVLERALGFLASPLMADLVSAVREGYVLPKEQAAELARRTLGLAYSLVQSAAEVAEPQSTVQVPGQRSYLTWDTPRGKGFVGTDSLTPPDLFCGMVLGPLLTGNGIIVAPSAVQRPVASVLARALERAGMPGQVLHLCSQGGPQAAASLADDMFHFAVVDMGLEDTQKVYERLGVTREEKGQSWLKALISMQDGPRPGEPGFLRLFVLPKTIAIRTLRHGAELEL